MARVTGFSHFIGAAGVDPGERRLARRVGIAFEIPMLIAALWVLLSWWTVQGHEPIGQSYDFLLWGLFIAETLVLSFVVRDRKTYLKSNWLNLLIIIFGLPLLLGWPLYSGTLRLLRLVVIFTLLTHVGNRVHKMLSRNELGATLLATLVVIVLAGVMMAALDPSITTPGDGIWWAWVTITTVGYGDIVPSTPAGRVLASIVILLGLGLFAMITATFAAFFIRQDEEKIISAEQASHQRLTKLERRLSKIESKIDLLLEQQNISHDKQSEDKENPQ